MRIIVERIPSAPNYRSLSTMFTFRYHPRQSIKPILQPFAIYNFQKEDLILLLISNLTVPEVENMESTSDPLSKVF